MLFGQEHVDRYRATGGEEGHEWRPGVYTLLLTTTGRKSGEARTTPLIYAPHQGSYTVVASKGGSDEPPAWYLNLSENPAVEVQVKGERFKANARTANAEEKPAKTSSIVWCTGFKPDWSWIDVPFLDETGYPDHHRGVVRPTRGLYVLGLPWLPTWGSGRFAGVARDAGHVAGEMVSVTAG